MFERFSDDARRAVVRALAEARHLGHDYVGTEHTLIALTDTPGAAADALAASGVSLERARAAAAEVVASTHMSPLRDDGPYTLRVSRAFEIARHQAGMLGHENIACGHLLLGILRLGEANGVLVLKHLDVDLDALREDVEHQLHVELPPDPPQRHRATIGAGRHLGIKHRRSTPVEPAETPVEPVSAPAPEAERRLSASGAGTTAHEPRPLGRNCSFCGHQIREGDPFIAGARATICRPCARACAQLLGDRQS